MGFKSVNIGNAQITGVDMTFTGQGSIWGIPATILAGYTYTNPVDLNAKADSSRTTEGNILKYRFYHSAKADLELRFAMVSTGISFVYHSNMINIDKAFEEPLIPFPEGTPQNVLDEFTILPGLKKYREENNQGSVFFDYRIIYHLSEKAELGLFLKNIFNAENMSRPGDISPPRNIAVKLNFLF
jgi:iron complex outermembrane receptor protein